MTGIAGFPTSSGGSGPQGPQRETPLAEVSAPVVVCTTQVAADLAVATLAAHGIQASTAFTHYAYPSLGWVEGYQVTVATEDEQEARELLSALEREDVHVTDDVDGDTDAPRDESPQ